MTVKLAPSSNHPDWSAAVVELIAAGSRFDRRGWVPATSGNLSARVSGGRMAITASGCHKGELTPGDFLDADLAGVPRSGRRASAETGLHVMLYDRDPACGAVLHVHSPGSTLIGLSALARGEVVFSGLELLKAFPGVASHAVTRRVPVVDNDQDIAAMARLVRPLLDRPDTLPAFVIAGHGVTAWGADVASARRHIEALEFLFDIQLRQMGAQSWSGGPR